MKYGTVPGVKNEVSRLAQGCMMLADGDKLEWSFSLLDAALEAGINTFDHSTVYGGGVCERVFGKWMADRGNRDRVVILSKGCHHNADRKKVTPFDIETDIHDALARFKTDHLDIWMFHRDDPRQPVGPLIEVLNRYIKNGVIGCFGGSNWSIGRIQEANAYARDRGLVGFTCSSPNFSLAEQVDSPWGPDCLTISGPDHAKDRAWYAETKMPVFTWSSLARGFFSGRIFKENFEEVKGNFEEHMIRCYVTEENWERLDRARIMGARKGLSVPQVALSFVLSQDLNSFALVGAYSREEIQSNIAALESPLTAEECRHLDLRD